MAKDTKATANMVLRLSDADPAAPLHPFLQIVAHNEFIQGLLNREPEDHHQHDEQQHLQPNEEPDGASSKLQTNKNSHGDKCTGSETESDSDEGNLTDPTSANWDESYRKPLIKNQQRRKRQQQRQKEAHTTTNSQDTREHDTTGEISAELTLTSIATVTTGDSLKKDQDDDTDTTTAEPTSNMALE